MQRKSLVILAQKLGWKPWGKWCTSVGNWKGYHCFRRGNKYIWIGNRFLESSDSGIAYDFVGSRYDGLSDLASVKSLLR